MARGWESKSIEDQQAEAIENRAIKKSRLSPEQIRTQQQLQGLMLSRQRVQQQLQSAQNPHHREMLQRALAELECRLAELPKSCE